MVTSGTGIHGAVPETPQVRAGNGEAARAIMWGASMTPGPVRANGSPLDGPTGCKDPNHVGYWGGYT